MRPRGDIRQAIAASAQALHAQRGSASWRDMAEHAQVGALAARRTVERMAGAGELVRVGYEKRAHSRRWVALYEPATGNFATATTGQGAAHAAGGDADRMHQALQALAGAWRR